MTGERTQNGLNSSPCSIGLTALQSSLQPTPSGYSSAAQIGTGRRAGGAAVRRGRSSPGPCQRLPPHSTPLPGEASLRHGTTPGHSKGSSPPEIPHNTAVPITAEPFQASRWAQVSVHAPGKVGLNPPASLAAQRPPALNQEHTRSAAAAFSPGFIQAPQRVASGLPNPLQKHRGTAPGLRLCCFA